MVKETAWCGYKQVYSFLQLMCLRTSLRSADDNTVGLIVMLKEITSPFIVMHG